MQRAGPQAGRSRCVWGKLFPKPGTANIETGGMSKYVRPKLKPWCVTPPSMEVGRQAPAKSVAYRVQDGDSWQSLATQWGVDVWSLINFNFRTYDPKVVNWYLQEYVGCVKPTADKRNWCFSSAAVPGIIYRPLEKPAVR